MNFAENIYDILKEKHNIIVEILSDAFFYDPFDEYAPDMNYTTPETFNSITLWDYKELGMPGHYWIYYNGKHYDSDHPNGVDNFFKLKTFKNFYENKKIK